MLDRIIATTGLAATIIVSVLLAPGTALAARQAVCEHPEGSFCRATRDTGRIECFCLDGEHELRNDELQAVDDSELMRACWDAWTMSCAPWKITAECDDPQLGSCEVNAEGLAICDCLAGSEEEEHVDALVGLGEEALEESCYEQIERICEVPQAAPVAGPAPVAPPVSDVEPAAASCSVDPQGAGSTALWMVVLAAGVGVVRRRR
ncbi:MYXO-CTERM sorting domain-containing protein [Paraliomyxa miuraensis]|uniref:MYXO-CTERM sorting domain-containing protein n=1 Tax=Paraliomyxa miuraensis TaxID=376150 RepID=UPI00225048A5|nr:MYXO-CTERM sorting domain-containing protein [Paraliomyxa miuraensis]MCX4243373.1 MYXO-CTERM sorting domain-containing protein [Paraliomyxa miuraensis]